MAVTNNLNRTTGGQHVRPAEERGHANFGWLNSRHTFSFGHYYDPKFMGFGPLRVINEDRVRAGAGLRPTGTATWRSSPTCSMARWSTRTAWARARSSAPAIVQRMSAGTGVRHSEYNASSTDPVHFLQIWILPEREGMEPSYEQLSFSEDDRRGVLKLIGSRDGREGSVTIHQDVSLYATVLSPGQRVQHTLAPGRKGWLQVARGDVSCNDRELHAGDGVAIEGPADIALTGRSDTEVLLFDMGE
jgi:redox-sensitive bicupin YhaK (pirin superfamily)